MTLFPISLGCYLVSVYHPRDRGNPQRIDWAAHAPAATVQNMGVDQRLVQMVPPLLPDAGIHPAVLLWEEVLPPPLPRRLRVLMEEFGDGGIVPWDSGEFRPGGKVPEGSPAETG